MAIHQQLLEILVCPKCKGSVSESDAGATLECANCRLKYPVREGVPVMLVDEAVDLRAQTRGTSASPALSAVFRITTGPNNGMVFHMEARTCKAVGRSLGNTDKISMFDVDLTLALDESTKSVIQKYISKQFSSFSKKEGEGPLGLFRRTSDIILDDTSVSKLHAMFFCDEGGAGVLDLVSKNGTFVNGAEVESKLLQKGDTIEIGESRIIYEG